jgi:hypothetical protein
MDKLHFSEEEVLGFLEELIISGEANQDEQNLYQDYLLQCQLKKFNHTYKQLVLKMRELFEIKY